MKVLRKPLLIMFDAMDTAAANMALKFYLNTRSFPRIFPRTVLCPK